tara:strand:- start:1101 stop:1262 length:162 start_codon:yes stop_codon:yes gene_type:complete
MEFVKNVQEVKKMINDTYQLVNELKCDELYFLKSREHFKSRKARTLVENKCGF